MAKASSQPRPTLPLNPALLRPGERVCVGVSGGADSTALLVCLHESAAALGIGLSAAHLHHGIRGAEADEDLAFLRDLCARLDVPLFTAETDVPAAAAAHRETMEEAARNARLRFFAEIVSDGRAHSVATAHTQDDQAETVAMKLLRGAWTEGLGGISPVVPLGSGRLIRPLLGASRAQVVAYLTSKGQTWREDSTNASDAHTRNRVRARLMPVLRDFNPQIDTALSSLAAIARDEEQHWSGEVARLAGRLVLPGKPVRGGGRAVGTAAGEQSVAIELERLRELDLATRRRVIRHAAAGIGCRLSSAETARILLLAGLAPAEAPPDPTVSSKPNSRLALPGGVIAERSVRELRLRRATGGAEPASDAATPE